MKPLVLAAIVAISILFAFPARGQLVPATQPKDQETKYLMKEGTYLGFRQVNLSMGEIGFEITISSNIKGKAAPTLEFRIDKPKGKKIGSLKIPDTADTTFNIKLTGQLKNAMGVHDLFLVARGSGEFNIFGFAFIRNY
ncbi:carbohydrate-binding protein [Chitinophaga niabensis]|uniref:carbohydrate-binding protein n=1 Tax=Chitinophaga niabensis TaxID=536979 RepID=UPI00094131AC|nr:carbohydrate-binding protein [Chitinophaga niabensis]